VAGKTGTTTRIWGIQKYAGKRGATYRLRWRAHGQMFSRSFSTRKHAEVFRSELLLAVRDAVPIDRATGLPVGEVSPEQHPESWLDLTDKYIDAKWPTISPRHRKSIAEALTNITMALIVPTRGRLASFDQREIASTLTYCFFARGGPRANENSEIAASLRSAAPLATAIGEPLTLRKVLRALSTKLDGTPASERTVTRKRATLNNVVEFAVELGVLEANPLPKVRQRSFGADRQIDPRIVVSHDQGDRLIDATRTHAPHLTAYFALLLYAGMRPAEARSIRREDIELPDTGWGRATLSRTEQRPGHAWTDDSAAREQRGLKHRPRTSIRVVPLRPSLVKILRSHLATFPCGASGELFASRTGKAGVPLSPPYESLVSDKSIYRAWAAAREQVLTSKQVASELGRRPYDLRHACLTGWLNAGVPPAQVAMWAGHSTRVLLDVYAGCIDGGEDAAMALIEGSEGP
jgi:integrase